MIHRNPDRRVVRTRKLLREALHSLIREKNYDDIVVKEILDRADVGRSAFYAHFRDKDELLSSSIEDLLANLQEIKTNGHQNRIEAVLWFSLPLLEHIERQHAAGGLRMGPRGRSILHQRLKSVLAKLILAQFKKNFGARRNAGVIPGELVAGYLASTFVLVLDWWVDSKPQIPAKAANEYFRELAVPALKAVASN